MRKSLTLHSLGSGIEEFVTPPQKSVQHHFSSKQKLIQNQLVQFIKDQNSTLPYFTGTGVFKGTSEFKKTFTLPFTENIQNTILTIH